MSSRLRKSSRNELLRLLQLPGTRKEAFWGVLGVNDLVQNGHGDGGNDGGGAKNDD